MANGIPNIWTQMNYMPPRGQCNFKQSVLSPKCPCLRFMLHPLKSTSSYECDGCTHHASFHSMENKTEDEVRKRWEQEAKEKADRNEETKARPKKRARAIEYSMSTTGSLFDNSDPDSASGSTVGDARGTTRARGRGGVTKKPGRRVGASSRITEVLDEDNAVVELD